ncbi:uncharacterized protein LOC126603538 [Malus sylvestris]|uniref:uncharacterized protein LOC126603538 n=1 Tax=Malus sylvestris TaxID=3752 RepID=UPI0021AC8822|nr:uncharacterized protein LOC126603538 [Malus sylvestris]
MEVLIPSRADMDFDFNSARSSPSVTAPSTPRRFGDFYMSAPTSPTRMSEFYRDFEEFSNTSNWKDDETASQAATPRSPKSHKREEDFGFDDFAFDVGEEVQRTSLSAEELFDGGIIRPLNKPPPTPSIFRKVLSPRRKKGKEYPFGLSSPTQMDNNTRRSERRSDQQQQRGRERAPAALSSSISGRRATRSVSPLRVSEYQWVEEEKQNQQKQQQPQQNNKQLAPTAMFTSCIVSKASRKWKLKDFLLFRSASEGRAADKDPFRKYSTLFRKNEDMKNSSFRSIDSPASVSSSRRKGPPVSAHELHYTVNKAASNDMKKKTFLPYKQGLLGRLAFNPAVSALANGFGSLSRK